LNASTYTFTVESRNVFGYSDPTAVLVLYVAFKPNTPTNLLTTVVGPDVLISWDAAVDNGDAITSYTIMIKQSDGAFSEQLSHCDGATPSIIANNKCLVPLTVL
jgi:hypothetical protein